MKMLMATILIMTQVQLSYANENEQKKCSKEICEAPVLNQALTKYCSENSNEKFEESVDDWGPYLNSDSESCWCSCKFDVKRN